MKDRNSHGRLREYRHVRNSKCHQQIAGQVFQCACAKSQCVMAQSVEVDIGQISGSFNLQSVFSYNVVNVGRLIINNWENTLFVVKSAF